MYHKNTEKLLYFIKNEASFQTVYRLSIVSQLYPRIPIARLAYIRLTAAAAKALPEDVVIYNFGQFIPFNHFWELCGIDGRRTPETEAALIESFQNPGYPVQSRHLYPLDPVDEYLAEVFHTIDRLTQFDAMKYLYTGNLRRFVRQRALDRFKDFKKSLYRKKRFTHIKPLVWEKDGCMLSIGLECIDAATALQYFNNTYHVEKVIRGIPAAQKIVSQFRQNPYITYGEIADELGVPDTVVKQQLWRIRKKVKKK